MTSTRLLAATALLATVGLATGCKKKGACLHRFDEASKDGSVPLGLEAHELGGRWLTLANLPES
jgi:hypothetical protein